MSDLDEALKLAREMLDGYRELLMQAHPVAPRSIEDCNYPEAPRSVIVARALLALAEQRTAEQVVIQKARELCASSPPCGHWGHPELRTALSDLDHIRRVGAAAKETKT